MSLLTAEYLKTILNESRQRMLADIDTFATMNTGEEFQAWTYETIKKVGEKYGFAFKAAGKQSFPDIYYDNIGIEVKFTIGNSWTSTGNSILEGTRINGIDHIFIYFGKKSPPDIRWNNYELCLSDIVVTHHPRYQINMEMEPDSNIFSKMGITYKDFVSGKQIEIIKKYYKGILGPGESLWWIGDDDGNEMASSLIISDFKNLNQDKLRIDAMTYFPDIFANTKEKYFMLAFYLLREYNALSTSLRDTFSSGGRAFIDISGQRIKVPKIYYHLFVYASKIKEHFAAENIDVLNKHWARFENHNTLNREEEIEPMWLNILDSVASTAELPANIKASDIYSNGLLH